MTARGTAGDSARNRVGDFPTLVGEARNWPAVLSALEGDVYEAEETLARGRAEEIAAWGRRHTDWIPPSNLGPLPDDLRERAARLLQHQLAVAEALVERITQSQKQRDVAARMSYAPTRPVASFIDRAL
ncbi:hypothetical protein [Modestobacter versicolor]|uniref:hypothetical protein n=1 Tax=Modestobacter versicolor TaxID=429133 RepID=UPI0034DF8FD7